MLVFGEVGCGGTSLGDSSLIGFSWAVVVLTVDNPLFFLHSAFPPFHYPTLFSINGNICVEISQVGMSAATKLGFERHIISAGH